MKHHKWWFVIHGDSVIQSLTQNSWSDTTWGLKRFYSLNERIINLGWTIKKPIKLFELWTSIFFSPYAILWTKFWDLADKVLLLLHISEEFCYDSLESEIYEILLESSFSSNSENLYQFEKLLDEKKDFLILSRFLEKCAFLFSKVLHQFDRLWAHFWWKRFLFWRQELLSQVDWLTRNQKINQNIQNDVSDVLKSRMKYLKRSYILTFFNNGSPIMNHHESRTTMKHEPPFMVLHGGSC